MLLGAAAAFVPSFLFFVVAAVDSESLEAAREEEEVGVGGERIIVVVFDAFLIGTRSSRLVSGPGDDPTTHCLPMRREC